jgi:SAM-dependent methyltransferase
MAKLAQWSGSFEINRELSMHPSAMDLGRLLFSTHGVGLRRVGDIGSLDVNGSLRSLCPEGVEYIGIDLAPGKGVDLVLDDPYQYPFPDAHFDMMVSTSCFEHDPMFWLTFLEMLRVVRDDGIIYINAPSSGSYHTHPWDNWRFYPDASLAMEMWGRRSGYPVHALESFTMSSDPLE